MRLKGKAKGSHLLTKLSSPESMSHVQLTSDQNPKSEGICFNTFSHAVEATGRKVVAQKVKKYLVNYLLSLSLLFQHKERTHYLCCNTSVLNNLFPNCLFVRINSDGFHASLLRPTLTQTKLWNAGHPRYFLLFILNHKAVLRYTLMTPQKKPTSAS